jgi:hypothetical protein
MMTRAWPKGTGQWTRTRIVIVSADETRREALLRSWFRAGIAVAATPLEVIALLERDDQLTSTVVVAGTGGSVSDTELVAFLDEAYPWVRIVVDNSTPANQNLAYEAVHA